MKRDCDDLSPIRRTCKARCAPARLLGYLTPKSNQPKYAATPKGSRTTNSLTQVESAPNGINNPTAVRTRVTTNAKPRNKREYISVTLCFRRSVRPHAYYCCSRIYRKCRVDLAYSAKLEWAKQPLELFAVIFCRLRSIASMSLSFPPF